MRLSRSLLLAALLTSLSCSDPLGPNDFPVMTTASAASFRAGEPISITVTVTNTTDDQQAVNANVCPFKFDVLRADGSVVGPISMRCTMELRIRFLAPGESLPFTFTWVG